MLENIHAMLRTLLDTIPLLTNSSLMVIIDTDNNNKILKFDLLLIFDDWLFSSATLTTSHSYCYHHEFAYDEIATSPNW